MKKYRDKIAQMCHKIVKDGHSLGILNDTGMKGFEADCYVQESKVVYKTDVKTPCCSCLFVWFVVKFLDKESLIRIGCGYCTPHLPNCTTTNLSG